MSTTTQSEAFTKFNIKRLREDTTVIYLSQLQQILNVKVISIRLEAIFFLVS